MYSALNVLIKKTASRYFTLFSKGICRGEEKQAHTHTHTQAHTSGGSDPAADASQTRRTRVRVLTYLLTYLLHGAGYYLKS
jgi:hypothetical protein